MSDVPGLHDEIHDLWLDRQFNDVDRKYLFQALPSRIPYCKVGSINHSTYLGDCGALRRERSIAYPTRNSLFDAIPFELPFLFSTSLSIREV